jgi:Na+/melibiose symporter-like transporter
MVLFLTTLFYFAAIVIRGNVMLPYFRYVAGNVDLFAWFNGFGLVSLIAGVACSTVLSVRVGKRPLFIASMILTGVLSTVLLFLPATKAAFFHLSLFSRTLSVPFSKVFLSEILRQFSYGLSGAIIWAMMGDVADYGEWKTGRRASGTVSAAVVFALWVGLALGGAVAGWILSGYGFVSEATVQTAHAQSGILLTASVYAGLAFFGAAVCFFFYPISRELNQKIANELAERRKGFAPGNAS